MDNLSPNPVIEAETIKLMDFPEAMREIIRHNKIRRQSWPQEDYALLLEGYLMIFTKGQLFKWLINDGDLEGTDWIVLDIN